MVSLLAGVCGQCFFARRCFTEDGRRVDAQPDPRRERGKPRVAAIKFYVRVFVERRRSSWSTDVANPYAVTFVANAKISDVENRDRYVRKISQAWIVEG